VPGQRTGEYRAAADLLPDGRQEIAHEDVADFLLRELTERRYPMRRVGITY
jgi:putative NADH-flavin reductase